MTDDQYIQIIERLSKLEERHESDTRAQARALEIQAKEYERRLDQLNGAHEKHERFAGTFVTEDIFHAYRESVSVKFDQIKEVLAEIRGTKQGKTASRNLVFEVITVAIAVLAVSTTIYVSLR